MVNTVLHDIRETEKKALQYITDAQNKATTIIAKGKTDAAALLRDRKEDIITDRTLALTKRKKELEKEVKKHYARAEKQGEHLVASANKKKAVSYLLAEFKKLI